MKKYIWIVGGVVVLLLIGLTLEPVREMAKGIKDSIKETTATVTNENVKFEGKSRGTARFVTVWGKSNLPKGAIVTGKLLDMETNNLAATADAEVDKNGSFTLKMDRPDREKDYTIEVYFLPEGQPDEVIEKYGSKGEKISKISSGYYTDGDVSGIRRTGMTLRLPKTQYSVTTHHDTALY
ncbi:hypothetical protein A8F94_20755 [Bacillus sp. FJAT-27225]|uniref:hypothetical protein n=1 Tax=Bacillus sp. FJAT-27225 TaxID=1743144 RepID=UPI00080C284F|nr:hypothetical protein [Bacillus sp. FJAT-27225]OCA82339.1 hypothetical protein A8F94_20755 [Bacillus sp. FJAT-27225]